MHVRRVRVNLILGQLKPGVLNRLELHIADVRSRTCTVRGAASRLQPPKSLRDLAALHEAHHRIVLLILCISDRGLATRRWRIRLCPLRLQHTREGGALSVELPPLPTQESRAPLLQRPHSTGGVPRRVTRREDQARQQLPQSRPLQPMLCLAALHALHTNGTYLAPQHTDLLRDVLDRATQRRRDVEIRVGLMPGEHLIHPSPVVTVTRGVLTSLLVRAVAIPHRRGVSVNSPAAEFFELGERCVSASAPAQAGEKREERALFP